MSAPTSIKVAVVEDHEIFRRGLLACLAEDPGLTVLSSPAAAVQPGFEVAAQGAGVAVVCGAAARVLRFECPLVVCAAERDEPLRVAEGNVVAGVLSRDAMTEAQLRATVRAAAAGLHVDAGPHGRADGLDERELRVLRLLAEGRTTHEIASDMSYSERTIKKHINDLEHRLCARTRAQIVAHAIRQGLI